MAFSFTLNEVTVENKKVRGWREDANLYSFNCNLSFVEKGDNDPTFFFHIFFNVDDGKRRRVSAFAEDGIKIKASPDKCIISPRDLLGAKKQPSQMPFRPQMNLK